MSAKRDYYEVLGVARDAEPKAIADAYRKLAMKYHPDRNPGDEECVVRFKEAAEAFEILHDKEKRARYDRFGHQATQGGQQFHDVSEIFEAFGDVFGEDIFGGLFGGRRGKRRGPSQGGHVRAKIRIDLVDAARGCTTVLKYDRLKKCETCSGSGAKPGTQPSKCSYCGGSGQVVQGGGFIRVQSTCPRCRGAGTQITDACSDCRGQGAIPESVSQELKVPAGVDTGDELRVSGAGNPSPDGGPPGDCFVSIEVREHSLFERDGIHLICRVPITFSQAVLGADVEVPTLAGRDTLSVPPGTQSGTVFTLRGKGLPDVRRRGNQGHLHVQVEVEVPAKVTPEQEKLLRDLARLDQKHVSAHRKSFFDKLKEFFVADESTPAEEKT